MQVGEIIERVRNTFGDKDSVQITDTTFFQWVDDAVGELAFTLDYNQAQAKTNVVIGQTEYVLPVNTFKVYTVMYNGKPLVSMSITEYTEYMGSSACSANPAGYMIWDGKIYLAAIPDTNITNGLHMFYSVLPERVSSHSQIPDLPQEYHTRIVMYCLAQAYLLDNDSAMYQSLIGQFKVETAAVKDKRVDSDVGVYPHILMTEDYEW